MIVLNPEIQSIIPPLRKDEYDLLEASIAAEGCRDALIVADDDTLLDGHNRYEICTRLGLPYLTQTLVMPLPTQVDRVLWVLRNQLGRRNLCDVDRGELALRLKPALAEQAKGRQGREEGFITDYVPVILPEHSPSTPRETREEIAVLAGVSGRTLDKIEAIVATATPALRTAVREYTASIHTAAEIATLPAEAQDELVARGKPAILAAAKHIREEQREVRREVVRATLEDISVQAVKAAKGVYDVVVIDPPWPMEKIERDERPNQVLFDYPTMSVDAIRKLVIPAAQDCHLWLWTTQKFLPAAFDILAAWDFKYVCTFVWLKPGGPQPFGLPQYNCEFALYGRKGAPKFLDTKAFPTCFTAERAGHSVKPEEFYDLLRRVTGGRRIDMCSRRAIQGFDAWGNQSEL